MMNELSLEEVLREQIGGLEAKIEAEVIENLRHLGDLRFYEEVQIPELQKQLSEARAENAKLRKLLATRIEATRLDEAVDQLAEARAEIERLKCCGNCEYCNHRIEVCEHPENSENAIMNDRCEHWQYDRVGC